MRKVFPIIVLLITLSVLGIIFIQMSWIKNAIELRRQQHDQEINTALSRIAEELHQRYFGLRGIYPINPSDDKEKEFQLRDFTTTYFKNDEIDNVVEQSIRRSGIKTPYSYVIVNIFQNPIASSGDFKNEYFSNSVQTLLTVGLNSTYRETIYLHFDEDSNYVLRQMGWIFGASILFTIIIISAFSLTVRTLFNQKKLSEVKTDFINNMTHELKTPLATISLAIDALTNQKVIHDEEKIRYYSGMIKEENKRMNKQVEKILQAARIERQDIKLNLQETDAHEVIRKVAHNLLLQIQERNGELNLNLGAAKHIINADDVHFSNIVFNLLDNAIKYSDKDLRITIETAIQAGMLAIKIKDNGIGMNKETQARIFEKFYRAHTGNLHNVKGFGLGLSYVKAIAEAHGGKVKVDSAIGKGSTFTLFLPLV